MTAYTADAVAMLRYLVDRLPPAADEVFTRAEQGIDSIEAPDVALAEVLTALSGEGATVAGITLQLHPPETLRRLVTNGPVDVATIDEHVLAVFASEVDLYTMHDGLIAATHTVHDTTAIISKDGAFDDAGLETVW